MQVEFLVIDFLNMNTICAYIVFGLYVTGFISLKFYVSNMFGIYLSTEQYALFFGWCFTVS